MANNMSVKFKNKLDYHIITRLLLWMSKHLSCQHESCREPSSGKIMQDQHVINAHSNRSANRSLDLALFTSQFLRLWLCFCKLIMLRFLSSYFTEVHKWILRKYFLTLSFKLMSPFPNPLSAELPMDKLTTPDRSALHDTFAETVSIFHLPSCGWDKLPTGFSQSWFLTTLSGNLANNMTVHKFEWAVWNYTENNKMFSSMWGKC